MTLVLSGALSMGGSTADRSINCELGCSGTAQISLDDAAARTLAGIPSGEIGIDDFYGASSFTPPTVFGEVSGGGYYMGTIFTSGSSYYLIMSPNASGCASCQWKTTQTTTGSASITDGYANTYGYLANGSHRRGTCTAPRAINGFTDWYWPAKCESNEQFTNRASAPAGQEYAATLYWTSTEQSTGFACRQNFSSGSIYSGNKTFFTSLRAIRRIAY